MTVNDHERVRELFLGGRDLEGAERTAYLERECGEDRELRREVEAMLSFEAHDPAFLSDPPSVAASVMGSFAADDSIEAYLEKLSRQSNTGQRFEERGEVARGGMGEILDVFDSDLRRSIAMKVIRGGERRDETGESPRSRSARTARFLEEARVTGQLEHPGVVPVHELGVDENGRVYFTMRRVAGMHLGSVFERIATGDATWTQMRAVRVLRQVCETMAFAHDRGVVHRDLKPANVMVGDYGEVYVMDWGLALARGREDRFDLRVSPEEETDGETGEKPEVQTPLLTMDGTVLGTPYFMPPEQAAGKSDAIDERSDVYAVGAMLYQLLAGAVPYATDPSSSPREVLAQVESGPPPSIERLAPEAPAELVAICVKAMSRQPSKRYADMMAMAADLSAYLEGRVVRAHRTGAMVELYKWVRRNRAHAATILITVASILLGLIISTDQYVEAQQERNAAESALGEAEWRGYIANVSAAARSMATGDWKESGLRLADCDPDLVGWEWLHLSLRHDLSRRQLRAHDFKGAVQLSADGTRAMTAGWDRTVRVWDVEEWEIVDEVQTRFDVGVHSAAMDPSGQHVVFSGEGRGLEVYRIGSGAEPRNFDDPDQPLRFRHHALRFLPDGRSFIAPSLDSGLYSRQTLRIFDLSSGVVRQRLDFDHGGSALDVHPDGDRVAYAGYQLTIWSLAQDRELFSIRLSEVAVASLKFHPRKPELYCGLWSGEVLAVSTEDGAVLSRERVHEQKVTSVDIRGGLLVTSSSDGTIRLKDLDTGEENELRGHAGEVSSVAIDPDGRSVYSAGRDGVLREFEVDSGSAASSFPALQIVDDTGDKARAIAYSYDGSKLVTFSTYGIRAWDAGTLELLWSRDTCGYSGAVGRDVVLAGNNWQSKELMVIDLATGQVRETFSDRTVNKITATADGYDFVLSGDSQETGGKHSSQLFDSRRSTFRTLTGWPSASSALAITSDSDSLRVLQGISHWSGDLVVWDERRPGTTERIQAHALPIQAIAIQPDGEEFVTASQDDDLRIWDAETLQVLHVLEAHEREVMDVAYDAEGKRIFSAGRDGTMRVWDAQEGELIATFRTTGREIVALAVRPGGEVATFDREGWVTIWDIDRDVARIHWRRARRLRKVLPLAEQELVARGAAVDLPEGLGGEDLQIYRDIVNRHETLGSWSEGKAPERWWQAAVDPDLPLPVYQGVVAAIRAIGEPEASVLHTQGVALYRMGECRRALEAFDAAWQKLEAKKRPEVRLRYLVWEVMCHAGLGDYARARQLFEELRHDKEQGGQVNGTYYNEARRAAYGG